MACQSFEECCHTALLRSSGTRIRGEGRPRHRAQAPQAAGWGRRQGQGRGWEEGPDNVGQRRVSLVAPSPAELATCGIFYFFQF